MTLSLVKQLKFTKNKLSFFLFLFCLYIYRIWILFSVFYRLLILFSVLFMISRLHSFKRSYLQRKPMTHRLFRKFTREISTNMFFFIKNAHNIIERQKKIQKNYMNSIRILNIKSFRPVAYFKHLKNIYQLFKK